jgi:hypothetical protein
VAELQSKTRGICRSLARVRDNAKAAELLADILTHDGTMSTADDHFSLSARLHAWIDVASALRSGQREGDRVVLEHAMELATFAYFTGTILEFFGAGLTESRLTTALASADASGIERLAESRQQMSMSLAIAQAHLTAFRQAWNVLPAAGGPHPEAAQDGEESLELAT